MFDVEGILTKLNAVYDIAKANLAGQDLALVANHLDAIYKALTDYEDARSGANCSLDGGYCESCAG